MLECKDCCYYWYNEEYEREMCNYIDPVYPAPCELFDSESDQYYE